MQHVNFENSGLIFEALAKVIRTKREALGKSQRVLADEFAFQRSLLSRLENGVNEPKLVSIWTVSEALVLRPHELIKMVEDELPESFSLIDR